MSGDRGLSGGLLAAPSSEAEPLRSYLRAKQSAAELLRRIERLVGEWAPWMSDPTHALMVRLAEDRFHLVVVGQFKRGKTSLMNAIVGWPLLPTGTIPVTSAVTVLRYGSVPKVLVRRAGHALAQEIAIGDVPAFITERGNPANEKKVLSVTIEVPVPFLRRGVQFVDTPGIGSALEHNTAATLAFLPEADAAIVVTSADGTLSDAELSFLDAVRQHIRKLFFVLNKVDQVNQDERQELVTYTTGLLAKRLGLPTVRLFEVSAALALASGADERARFESGVPALESALARFLTDQRRSVFLTAVLDRAIEILDEARAVLDIRHRSLGHERDTSNGPGARLSAGWDAVEENRCAALERAGARTAAWEREVLEPALVRFATVTGDKLTAALPVALEGRMGTKGVGGSGAVWVHEELEQRCATWLKEFAEEVDRFCQGQVRDVEIDLRALTARIADLLASVAGTPPHSLHAPGMAQIAEPWAWTAPAFEPPTAAWFLGLRQAPGVSFPRLLPLPRAATVWLATHRISREVPGAIDRLVAALRQTVTAHVHQCVTGMAASTAAYGAEIRRRIEHLLAPETPGARTSDGASETAARLDTLQLWATAMRDALLQDDPVPDLPETAAQPGMAGAGQASARDACLDAPETSDDISWQPGTCAICAAASDAVFTFLCRHQFAIAADAVARRAFLAAGGLCPPHTWHLERVSSPRGLSTSYPVLLDRTADRLREMSGLPVATVLGRLGDLWTGPRTCPACHAQQQAEQAAAERLVRSLSRPRRREQFEQSGWVCLTHLHLLLAGLDGDTCSRLLRLHARRLGTVGEAMREYVMKLAARRRSLLSDEEMCAYRQGLVLLAGERYLHRTEPEE